MASRTRLRLLCVLSPSNQMYSGIGRAVFELAARLGDRVQFEFAMSNYFTKNLEILKTFCREHELSLHVGVGRAEAESLDTYNDSLPALLGRRRWDAVECVCWANAATNQGVLENLRDEVLCYTPHDQPVWTVPMSPAQAGHIETIHRRMLLRSDVVCCDSLRERTRLQKQAVGLNNCRYLPLGCDFKRFRPGPSDRREQLLFVGDLAEPRKRFDRVLAVLDRLLLLRPSARLVVVGNRSNEVDHLIPAHLRHACELRGYVDEPALHQAYAESSGLILLSDFEAFGIPILEALACATPVFLSTLDETRSLFGGFRGAHFCQGDDAGATAEIIARTLAQGRDAIEESRCDLGRLRATFDWDVQADRKWDALAAAWFLRRSRSWTA